MTEKRAARVEQEQIRALAHPTRAQILEALQGREASPAELSQETGQKAEVISYHAKTLAECGCLELVRTQRRDGAIEHFFRAAPESSLRLARRESQPSAD